MRRIDPQTNAVTDVVRVGDSPQGLAVGGGGIWVANGGDGTVSKIDPRSDRVVQTVRVGGRPTELIAAAGRIWVSVQSRVAPATGGSALRVDYSYDIGSLDPPLAGTAGALQVEYAICAKLLNYPDEPAPQGTRVVPEVAQALPRRSADGKMYTFTVRPGFRFSPPSHAPVTAQTFKASIERALDARMRISSTASRCRSPARCRKTLRLKRTACE